MMKSSALLLLLLLLPACHAAIQCSDVIQDMTPCVMFLRSGVGAPSTQCCTGVSNLANAATTTADRRAACNCLQRTARLIQPNVAAAKALASRCGFSLPFTFSTNINCSQIG